MATKLNESGALIYSTYLGGNGSDEGWGIAVDGAGNIHITGNTDSTDFPVAQPLQPTLNSRSDAFVTKIGANGDTLIFSTYLGGNSFESGDSIAVDGAGNIGVAGHTTSQQGFPVFPVSQPTFGGGTYDAFVAKLSLDGQAFRYFTYLGGSGNEPQSTLALDQAGNAYITGYTTSTNFPTRFPLQNNALGMNDAFVTKLDTAGERLYSTYLGGSGDDYGEEIAINSAGRIYIAMGTSSTDLPLVNPAQAQSGGFWDAYMATINPSSSGAASLIYGTYLGGGGYDYANSIAVDDAGDIYVSGHTLSTDFPTVNPIQAAHGGNEQWDVFVAKLNVADRTFVFSTYLGGDNVDGDGGIAVDSANNIYITGNTRSTNFPTANPLQPTIGGDRDAFVTKLTPTYTISGHVRTGSGTGVPDITISAGAGQTATTGGDGSYMLSGLLAGTYTITPNSKLYTITPLSRNISLPETVTSQDFTAATSPVNLPLILTAPPAPPPADCKDDLEDNDRPDQARPLTLIGRPCTGSFQNDAQGQDDYYRVQLAAGQTISIDLTSIVAGADYDLVLYDAQINQLGVSKTPGQENEHIAPVTAAQSGRYYIRIFMRVKSSSTPNTYVLQVNIS